jgi:hypothetical protein
MRKNFLRLLSFSPQIKSIQTHVMVTNNIFFLPVLKGEVLIKVLIVAAVFMKTRATFYCTQFAHEINYVLRLRLPADPCADLSFSR